MGKLFTLFTQKLGARVSATLAGAAYNQPASQVSAVMSILGCKPPIEILREKGDLTDEEAIKLFIRKIKDESKEKLQEWHGSGLKPVIDISNIGQMYDFVHREENDGLLELTLEKAIEELSNTNKERKK